MIAKLLANRVRRMYLGGGRIDAFCGVPADVLDGVPRPADWLASTTQAFNGAIEIDECHEKSMREAEKEACRAGRGASPPDSPKSPRQEYKLA